MKPWRWLKQRLRDWRHPPPAPSTVRTWEMIEELRLRMKIEKLLRGDSDEKRPPPPSPPAGG